MLKARAVGEAGSLALSEWGSALAILLRTLADNARDSALTAKTQQEISRALEELMRRCLLEHVALSSMSSGAVGFALGVLIGAYYVGRRKCPIKEQSMNGVAILR
jgi:hypothetical protein